MSMKRFMAGVCTVAIMALLVWSGARRVPRDQAPASADTATATSSAAEATHPAEARIQDLLESARLGAVPAYLAAFDGPIKSRLEREVDERGRAGFAADLRNAARTRKSHAVFSAEPDGDETARVVVENVYPDRNERQTYRVDRKPGGWLVTEVETLHSRQPKAQFGDQADYQAPEGVPVQMIPNTPKPAGGEKPGIK